MFSQANFEVKPFCFMFVYEMIVNIQVALFVIPFCVRQLKLSMDITPLKLYFSLLISGSCCNSFLSHLNDLLYPSWLTELGFRIGSDWLIQCGLVDPNFLTDQALKK